MMISNMRLRSVGRNDPRYPADTPMINHYSEVYLLECDTDGEPLECTFFMGRTPSPEKFAQMLQLFAGAVLRMGKPETDEAA